MKEIIKNHNKKCSETNSLLSQYGFVEEYETVVRNNKAEKLRFHPVSCEVRGTLESGGKFTGPIKPGTTYGYGTYWDCLWYNYSAKKLVLTEINIEYMDGSSIHINKNELKYVR